MIALLARKPNVVVVGCAEVERVVSQLAIKLRRLWTTMGEDNMYEQLRRRNFVEPEWDKGLREKIRVVLDRIVRL